MHVCPYPVIVGNSLKAKGKKKVWCENNCRCGNRKGDKMSNIFFSGKATQDAIHEIEALHSDVFLYKNTDNKLLIFRFLHHFYYIYDERRSPGTCRVAVVFTTPTWFVAVHVYVPASSVIN